MSRRLTTRQLGILFCLHYMESMDEYQPDVWISYSRLADSTEKAVWLYGEKLDDALQTLERLRLVTLQRPVISITGIQLTESGRRVAARINPFLASVWIGWIH